MPYRDKEKLSSYRKQYYEKNKDSAHQYYLENKEKYKKRNSLAKERNRTFINQFKLENGCSKCGYNKHPSALDFHHKNDKKDGIARMVNSSLSLSAIQEEMSKCVLLCSNCHREEHEKK